MADRHKTTQTAFRLPEGLLAWLRGQAAKENPVTMTHILVRALEAERERCAGITTCVTTAAPAEPVSPPPAARRKPRKPKPPPATFKSGPEGAEDIAAFFRRRNGEQG